MFQKIDRLAVIVLSWLSGDKVRIDDKGVIHCEARPLVL